MTAFRLFVGRLSSSLPTTTPTPIPIAAFCKEGRLNEAVHGLHSIHDIVESSTYVYILQCCIRKKALHQGKRIHALILNRNHLRFTEDVFLHTKLLQMYVKCGSFVDARDVFDRMVERDVCSWNAMIAAYRKQGLSEEAFALFHEMQRSGSGVQPDEFTFASVLPACISLASLEEGVGIHRKIIRSGFHSDVVVTNALINMYAKFGNLQKARELFDKIKDRTTISWNAMIAGYAENGFHEEALEVFEGMQRSGVFPDALSWNVMVAAYRKQGLAEEALDLFHQMQRNGSSVLPNEFIFCSVLPNSASLEDGVETFILMLLRRIL